MMAALAPGAANADSLTTTFSTTGGPYAFRVPRTVTSVQVHAIGGTGGPDSAQGAEVTTTLAVTPGQAFYVYVAGNGRAYDGFILAAGGFNGGGGASFGAGGGGASDIRTSSGDLSTRLVVAAGAGGGGSFAAGGAAGAPGSSAVGGNLAQPGGANAGGAGGTNQRGSSPGGNGAFGVGGNAGEGFGQFGGGGGGGWYGGGGGAGYQGGAGGSNYITPNGTTGTTQGLTSNAPVVELTYTSPAPATSMQLVAQPDTIAAGGTSTVTATVQEQSGAAAYGDVLTFASSASEDSFGAVTDHGDGTYTATLTAGNTPGAHTITVTDTSVTPALSRQITVNTLEAQSLTVTTTSDTTSNTDGKTTLREALAYAAQLGDGQTITFDGSLISSGPVIITLDGGELQVAKDVTITGPGAGLLAIDGAGASRVLHVPSGKTASISGVTIRGGKVDDVVVGAGSGGGVANEGSLTLTDCTLASNTAGGTHLGNGGAIYHHGTALTLNRCTVQGNSTKLAGYGGAIHADTGTVTLIGSTFSSNTASGNGGAVANLGATLTATNCTFGQNNALNGGAVIQYEGAATLIFCTVAENAAQATGGGLERVGRMGGTFTLNSTLVAANTAANQGPDLSSFTDANDGAFVTQGSNLIGIGDGAIGFTHQLNGDQVGASNAPIDARLGTLNVYGGNTATYPLLFGSPAIDAGGSTALLTDQRGNGFDRVLKGAAASAQAAADAGAFELLAPPTVANASLVYASNDAEVLLMDVTGAAPPGGTFSGAGVISSPQYFNPSAAGVGVHTLAYVISDAGGATNEVTFTVEVLRYRGGAVDDLATNGSGGTILRPLANDIDGVPTGRITGVSDSAIHIGADGRTLIVPAGYAGTFFYTVDGLYTADVTIAAATGAATALRWEGLMMDANTEAIGAGVATRSAKGTYTATLRTALGSVMARFTLPSAAPVTVKTKIGDVVFRLRAGGALEVQLPNGVAGLLYPVLKAAPATQYNIALASTDFAVPGGGFLILTVKAKGAATLAGTLPDGRRFSAGAYELDAQSFAFYGAVAGSSPKGFASGTLTLASLASTDVTGEIGYVLPKQKTGLHAPGLNTLLTANGSTFLKGTLPFPDGQIGFTASGGDLANDVAATAIFTHGVPALAAPLSAWTYNKNTGAFSVKLRTAPVPAPLKTVKGFYLPKTTRGWGYFPGTTVGGRVIVQP